MASAQRVFRIYHRLGECAAEISECLAAKGDQIPGTVQRLIAKDRGKLLMRWGEEMEELCGVLAGTHRDPYLMEATQTFYWASLYAVASGADWNSLNFDAGRRQALTCSISDVIELRANAKRLAELGPDKAKPEKLFLLWNIADRFYREKTDRDQQWSLDQLMEADLQEMKKREYLQPILQEIGEAEARG